MKIFPSDGVHPFVPRTWLDALSAPGHVRQAEVIAVAENRAALAELLASVRAPRVAASLRLRRGLQSTSNQALIDAGVILLDVPGVWVYVHAVKDSPVIRVTPVGCALAAWFRRPNYAGPITVEAVKW